MRLIKIVLFAIFFLSCGQSTLITKDKKSVIDIINNEHQNRAGIKSPSSFKSYDTKVYENRRKAAQLLSIETDTANIKSFIVLDDVSFEGGNTSFGEMVINDTTFFYYKTLWAQKNPEKFDGPIYNDKIILRYLKQHRFAELEALATEKGKNISGSNFIYIGMFEKGWDSVYVKLLPLFTER